jgi:mannose-6-phosphate isomerase-like protein (cupin superfamily)
MAEPAIVPHNAGEVISDHDRKRVEILADTEQIVITESWYLAGERGPDPHVHHHHVDAFYILEGTIVFGVGPRVVEEVVAAAGTLVLVPPDVVHTFWNPGPDRASYLNYHAPNSGFAEFLRAARDGRRYEWDSYDAPGDGGLPAEDAVVRGPGEGEVVVLSETSAILKAESADAGGRFSMVETTLAPGYAGPGPHVHESFVDSFYVLEGAMTMRVGDEHRTLGPGDFAVAPPGTVHTFANESESPVRMLNVLAPAGFERYLKELAALGDRPDEATTAALASKYDFRAAD